MAQTATQAPGKSDKANGPVSTIEGLQWSVGFARVVDVNSFQTDQGERLAYVKLEWFGGAATIMVDPQEAQRFQPYVRKFVAAFGLLEFDPAKKRAKFHLSDVREVSL